MGQVEKGRVWIKSITSQSVRTGLIVVQSSHAPGLKAMFEKYDREVDDDDEQQKSIEKLKVDDDDEQQNVLQLCW